MFLLVIQVIGGSFILLKHKVKIFLLSCNICHFCPDCRTHEKCIAPGPALCWPVLVGINKCKISLCRIFQYTIQMSLYWLDHFFILILSVKFNICLANAIIISMISVQADCQAYYMTRSSLPLFLSAIQNMNHHLKWLPIEPFLHKELHLSNRQYDVSEESLSASRLQLSEHF